MIILDENIPDSERIKVRRARIPTRQIGIEVGRRGMDDRQEIIPLLHRMSRVTFFTRDADFCNSQLCHPNYCLVYLEVPKAATADYVRRFLRHSRFASVSDRVGAVVCVTASRLRIYRSPRRPALIIGWDQTG